MRSLIVAALETNFTNMFEINSPKAEASFKVTV